MSAVEVWRGDENQVPLEEATLEELADACDQRCESANYHEFVGVHRYLAATLYRRIGRDAATVLMRDVARYGSLMQMGSLSPAMIADGITCKGPWHEFVLPVAK